MAMFSGRDRRNHPLPQVRESGLLSFREEMNRLLDDFFRGESMPSPSGRTGEFIPAIDVREIDDEIEVSAELPGMSEDDIRVELDEERLTISGEKGHRREGTDEEGRVWRESSRGRFVREVPLPSSVRTDAAEASYRNGVLTVHVPKSDESRSKRRRIEIGAS
jgi:HSP20 family protein